MKIFKHLAFALIAFVLAYSMLAIADAPAGSPAPAAVAVIAAPPVAPSGLAGLVSSKGGLIAFVMLCLICLNSVMSAVRLALYKWDGVDLSADVSANTTLTTVNKVCLVLGKVVDFFGNNTQHS